MSTRLGLKSILLLFLFCLPFSCASTSRVALPPLPEELPRLALVIQEGPAGQVVHSWRPASEFQEAVRNLPASSFRGHAPWGAVVLTGGQRDCDQEQIDCHRECMRRKLSPPLNYIPRGHPTHNEICRGRCLRAYNDCVDATKARTLLFPAVEGAVEWLKEHRTELLVGTVVVMAGVTFVVVTAGAGLVVLAPLTLMASAGSMDAPLCPGDWQ